MLRADRWRVTPFTPPGPGLMKRGPFWRTSKVGDSAFSVAQRGLAPPARPEFDAPARPEPLITDRGLTPPARPEFDESAPPARLGTVDH